MGDMERIAYWIMHVKEEVYEQKDTKKHILLSQNVLWCGRWDLNPYVIQHTPLKRACLPIPALPRIQLMHLGCNGFIIFKTGALVNT